MRYRVRYFRGIRGLSVYREEIYLVAENESGLILLVVESTARTQLSTFNCIEDFSKNSRMAATALKLC